jgi:hypothetical protein
MSKLIKFYTQNRPKCQVLKNSLDKRDMNYETITDEKLMLDKGFTHVPMLEVNGTIMEYGEAFKWINEQED